MLSLSKLLLRWSWSASSSLHLLPLAHGFSYRAETEVEHRWTDITSLWMLLLNMHDQASLRLKALLARCALIERRHLLLLHLSTCVSFPPSCIAAKLRVLWWLNHLLLVLTTSIVHRGFLSLFASTSLLVDLRNLGVLVIVSIQFSILLARSATVHHLLLWPAIPLLLS